MGMKPPSSVQVGPYKYRVIVSKMAIIKANADAKDSRVGESDHSKQIITIDPKLGPDQLVETLLHEVLHAVNQVGGRFLDEDDVLRLSPLLLDTLRRNPELVEYLLNG